MLSTGAQTFHLRKVPSERCLERSSKGNAESVYDSINQDLQPAMDPKAFSHQSGIAVISSMETAQTLGYYMLKMEMVKLFMF